MIKNKYIGMPISHKVESYWNTQIKLIGNVRFKFKGSPSGLNSNSLDHTLMEWEPYKDNSILVYKIIFTKDGDGDFDGAGNHKTKVIINNVEQMTISDLLEQLDNHKINYWYLGKEYNNG